MAAAVAPREATVIIKLKLPVAHLTPRDRADVVVIPSPPTKTTTTTVSHDDAPSDEASAAAAIPGSAEGDDPSLASTTTSSSTVTTDQPAVHGSTRPDDTDSSTGAPADAPPADHAKTTATHDGDAAPSSSSSSPGPSSPASSGPPREGGGGTKRAAADDDSNAGSPPPPVAKRRSARAQLNKPPDFVVKLYAMFMEVPSMITWDLGKILIPGPSSRFAQVVLTKYFRTGKFTSFQRQLNNFGFHKKIAESSSKLRVYARGDMLGFPPEALLELRRKQGETFATWDPPASPTELPSADTIDAVDLDLATAAGPIEMPAHLTLDAADNKPTPEKKKKSSSSSSRRKVVPQAARATSAPVATDATPFAPFDPHPAAKKSAPPELRRPLTLQHCNTVSDGSEHELVDDVCSALLDDVPEDFGFECYVERLVNGDVDDALSGGVFDDDLGPMDLDFPDVPTHAS